MNRGQHGSASGLWNAVLDATWYDWLGLFVLLAVAGWLVLKLKSRFQDRDDREACDHLLLSQLGDLHTQGDLTDEEYRSIKSQLASRIESSSRREGPRGS